MQSAQDTGELAIGLIYGTMTLTVFGTAILDRYLKVKEKKRETRVGVKNKNF